MLKRSIRAGDLVLGAGLLLFGFLVLYQTTTISVGFSYAVVGPRLLPFVVSCGFILTGAFIFFGAFLGNASDELREEHDWLPVVLISFAMILQMLLIRTLGWIPVTTVSYAIAAWAFGSRRLLLNLAVGLAVSSVLFVGFNYGLGLRLPAGPFADFFSVPG